MHHREMVLSPKTAQADLPHSSRRPPGRNRRRAGFRGNDAPGSVRTGQNARPEAQSRSDSALLPDCAPGAEDTEPMRDISRVVSPLVGLGAVPVPFWCRPGAA